MKALVTGVSSGIGRSICLQLAQDALARGEQVDIVASATGKSNDVFQVVDELKALGARAQAITGNLTDAEDPVRVVEQAIEFCGGLDALVNNAGFPLLGSLMATKLRHWDLMFSINVRSTWLMGRAAHAALKASQGSICAISSAAAGMVSPGLPGYSASKAALNMLIQEMAHEWGPDGIRANSVSPGMTRSRSNSSHWEAHPEDVEYRRVRVPLRRLGEPEDIAQAVSFLVGPNSRYITGENISVDGGMRHVAMDYLKPPSSPF